MRNEPNKSFVYNKPIDQSAPYDGGCGLRYWWDRLLSRTLFERVRMTLEEVRDLRDFTLLDVGCGSGVTIAEPLGVALA